MDGLLDGSDFLHQFLVHGEAAGSIDNHRVEALGLGFLHAFAGDLHGVLLLEVHVDGHLNLLGKHAQLLHGSGAVNVAGHEEGLAVLLVLEQEGQLAREGRLTRTVQTGHEDDGWTAAQFQFAGLTAHELGEFVVDNLHHELSGLHAGQHVLAECLLLHGVGEGLGHFVVYVGVEECAANVLEGFGHIDLGDAAFALEYFKRPFESFA